MTTFGIVADNVTYLFIGWLINCKPFTHIKGEVSRVNFHVFHIELWQAHSVGISWLL